MEKETIPTVKIGSKTLYTLFVLILFIVVFATLSSNKSDGVSQASVNSASALYAMEKTFDFAKGVTEKLKSLLKILKQQEN